MENEVSKIFGIRAVIEAINSGKTISKVYLQKGLTGHLFSELNTLIKTHNIANSYVPIEKLNRFSKNSNHQGVVAQTSAIDFTDLEDLIADTLEKTSTPLFLLLDKISDVRNFGAIIRTAECTGVDGIIIQKQGNAPVSADTIKTSAGALFKIPVCKVTSLSSAVDFLKGCGLNIFACTEKSDILINKIDGAGPKALIIGSEEDGVDSQLLKISDVSFKIPMTGTIASLNVSVASGIAIHKLMG